MININIGMYLEYVLLGREVHSEGEGYLLYSDSS